MKIVDLLVLEVPAKVSCSLTVQEGDGVGADGVQSHRLFAVLGAAALVFLLPPEEGPPGRRRQGLARVFLHLRHAVPAVELLVHPDAGEDGRGFD